MDENISSKLINIISKPGTIIETKEYELKLNNDIYILKLEIDSNNKIYFKLRQINNISYYNYYNEFTYEELINILCLPSKIYENMNKIFIFYNTALLKNKVILSQNKNIMILLLKINIGFDEVESSINLNEYKITNEEMIKILFDELRQIKLNKISLNNNINNNNDERLNKIESKLNSLIEENKKKI